jgi:AMP deaminase
MYIVRLIFFVVDEAIAAELRELYKTFQTCLDLREKYMIRSKQRFFDDPKNKPGWQIYPPPPPLSWSLLPPEELAKEKAKEKVREADPIAAIGIDFDMKHVKIPDSHPVSDLLTFFYFYL